MKKDISVIPDGPYCYSGDYICPYLKSLSSLPEQENGYCKYLEKSDWDFNEERTHQIIWPEDKKTEMLTAHEVGIPMSLLWDQCKMCGIKDDVD